MWLQQLVLRVILSRFLLWESSVRFLALSLQCFDDRDECMIENDGTTINYLTILFSPFTVHGLYFLCPSVDTRLVFQVLVSILSLYYWQNENSV